MLASTLPVTLRQVRQARRLSQLELSLRLGVSQRHVSFVESGRAKPSRELLTAWLKELETPLVLCNEAMLQAGYAPVYNETPLESPALFQVNDALQHLLSAHDPMPALVIDADWNVLRFNRGGKWLAALLVPWAADQIATVPVNLLDLMAHPEGLTKFIVNLPEVGPSFLANLRHQASMQPALTPKVEAVASLLSQLGMQSPQPVGSCLNAPVLTTRYATPYGELAFFSMFTTFGSPQDITLASLRVEHMFAANEATQAMVQAQVQ